LRRHCGANLLHCRSPFYLCLEHVDNLGAYRIPPETGLLIPSDNNRLVVKISLSNVPTQANTELEWATFPLKVFSRFLMRY
ncbi:MAG: hypothetical protein WA628_12100, partial [Terriglobales bacterium]